MKPTSRQGCNSSFILHKSITAYCYNTSYTGAQDPKLATPLKAITPQQVMDKLRELEKRVKILEGG